MDGWLGPVGGAVVFGGIASGIRLKSEPDGRPDGWRRPDED